MTLSRLAVERLEDGLEPQQAAEDTIETFADLTDSTAGVIVLDDAGRVGSAYNSQAM